MLLSSLVVPISGAALASGGASCPSCMKACQNELGRDLLRATSPVIGWLADKFVPPDPCGTEPPPPAPPSPSTFGTPVSVCGHDVFVPTTAPLYRVPGGATVPASPKDLNLELLRAFSPEFRFDSREPFWPIGYDQYILSGHLCWFDGSKEKNKETCMPQGAVTPSELMVGICFQDGANPHFLSGGPDAYKGEKDVYCTDQAGYPSGDYVYRGTIGIWTTHTPPGKGFFIKPSETTKRGVDPTVGAPVNMSVEPVAGRTDSFAVQFKLFYGYNLYPVSLMTGARALFAPVLYHEWDNESVKLTFQIEPGGKLALKAIRPSQHYDGDSTTLYDPDFCNPDKAEFVEGSHVRSYVARGDHANYLKAGNYAYDAGAERIHLTRFITSDPADGRGAVFQPWRAPATTFPDNDDTIYHITFGTPRTDEGYKLLGKPQEIRPIFH